MFVRGCVRMYVCACAAFGWPEVLLRFPFAAEHSTCTALRVHRTKWDSCVRACVPGQGRAGSPCLSVCGWLVGLRLVAARASDPPLPWIASYGSELASLSACVRFARARLHGLAMHTGFARRQAAESAPPLQLTDTARRRKKRPRVFWTGAPLWRARSDLALVHLFFFQR